MRKFVSTRMNIMCAGFSFLISPAKFSSLFWENMVFLQLRKAIGNTGYIFLNVKEEEGGLQVKKARQQKIKNIIVVVLTCSNCEEFMSNLCMTVLSKDLPHAQW